VKSLEDMRGVLQFNDWKHDPLSLGKPGHAVSPRFDLPHPGCREGCSDLRFNGGIDSKIVDRAGVLALSAWAVSGPTRSHAQPPFRFPVDFPARRDGTPDVYDFPWVHMVPPACPPPAKAAADLKPHPAPTVLKTAALKPAVPGAPSRPL
jgi:hypothetical protein